MKFINSQERENKLVQNMITEIYHALLEDDGVLTSPSKEHGIFKYTGFTTKTQGHFSKLAKKRDTQRPGIGFVIRRANFPYHTRVSIDIEISQEVSGKDPQDIYNTILNYVDTEYPMMLPPIITYSQPAYSGKRGWAVKTFIGIEIDLEEKDMENLNKTQKRLLDQIKKILYALDYALTEA